MACHRSIGRDHRPRCSCSSPARPLRAEVPRCAPADGRKVACRPLLEVQSRSPSAVPFIRNDKKNTLRCRSRRSTSGAPPVPEKEISIHLKPDASNGWRRPAARRDRALRRNIHMNRAPGSQSRKYAPAGGPPDRESPRALLDRPLRARRWPDTCRTGFAGRSGYTWFRAVLSWRAPCASTAASRRAPFPS